MGQWHPFSLFFGGCPTKMVFPKKGSFFSRVTEQLRTCKIGAYQRHHSTCRPSQFQARLSAVCERVWLFRGGGSSDIVASSVLPVVTLGRK